MKVTEFERGLAIAMATAIVVAVILFAAMFAVHAFGEGMLH